MSRELKIVSLKTSGYTSPIGISTEHMPFFSWQLLSERDNAVQHSFRLTVYRGFEAKQSALIWDSGVIVSELQALQYSGRELEPRSVYRWRVECQDDSGAEGHAEACFETALGVSSDGKVSDWCGAEFVAAPKKPLITDGMTSFSLEVKIELKRSGKFAGIIFCGTSRFTHSDSPDTERLPFYYSLMLDATGAVPILKLLRCSGTDNKNEECVATFGSDGFFAPEKLYSPHVFKIISRRGLFSVMADGELLCGFDAKLVLAYPKNEISIKNTTQTFRLPAPALGSIGFCVGSGDTAFFYDLKINGEFAVSESAGSFFAEDIREGRLGVSGGRYRLFGGKDGKTVIGDPSRSTVSLLRTTFRFSEPYRLSAVPVSARIYCSATGELDLYCGGERLTKQPVSFSGSDSSMFFGAYSLNESLLLSRELSIGFAVFGCREGFEYSAVIALLSVRFSDGSELNFPSHPENFRTTDETPYFVSGVSGGVFIGARSDIIAGFSVPGFDDDKWKNAISVGTPQRRIYPDPERARDVKRINPKPVFECKNGAAVYDFSVSLTGYLRFVATGKEKIVVKLYSEKYGDAGILSNDFAGAFDAATFTFYPSNVGVSESFETRFPPVTFRYAELRGCAFSPKPSEIEAVPLVYAPPSASFVCDDKNLNRLFRNIARAISSSFIRFPLFSFTGEANPEESMTANVPALQGASVLCSCEDVFRRSLLILESDPENLSLILQLSELMYISTRDARYNEASVEAARLLIKARNDIAGELSAAAEINPGTAPKMYAQTAMELSHAVAKLKSIDGDACRRANEILCDLRRDFSAFFVGDLAAKARESGSFESFSSYSAPLYAGVFENEFKALSRLRELTAAFGDGKPTVMPDTATAAIICKYFSRIGRQTDAEALLRCERAPLWFWQLSLGSSSLREYACFSDSTELVSDSCCAGIFVAEFLYGELAGLQSAECIDGILHLTLRPSFFVLTRQKAGFETRFGRFEIGWSQKSSVIRLFMTVPQCCRVKLELTGIKDLRCDGCYENIVVERFCTSVFCRTGKYELLITQ